MPYSLCNSDKSAPFKDVMHRASRLAIALRQTAFPRKIVAIPTVKRKTAAQFALFAGVFVSVQREPASGRCL